MKKHFIATLLIPATFLFLLLNSCGNNSDNNPPTDSLGGDSTANTTDTSMNHNDARVPSPSDLFAYLKVSGVKDVNANFLNPVDNEKKYESKKAMAINLGIYSADLLYCSTFSISDKVVSYFGACMRMGDKLKVATNLSDKDKDRINKNAGNGDSLIAISNDMYLSSFENLENTDRGADLSLMLSGGWIEGLYLNSTLVKDFEKDKSIAMNLVEQRIAISNLIDFMATYDKDADVKSVEDQLKDLKSLMDAVTSSGGTSGPTKKDGKLHIGGGPKMDLSKDQFDAITKKIADIRNMMITLN
ncbi:MAG TPA: hypothetical protein VL651_10695 [Bacteroidia bacterium]|jgi:hypothetical protein|nr:hypothetical protein [Bacteroidia bacterium]